MLLGFSKSFLLIVLLLIFGIGHLDAKANEIHWQLGAVIGHGVYETPLRDKENIGLSIIPQIDVNYGNFTLKNTTFTYDLFKTDVQVLSIKGRHNFDGIYHYADNEVFAGGLIDRFPDQDAITSPVLSYMAGPEFVYLSKSTNSLISTSYLVDVSNVHHGHEMDINWTQIWHNNKIKLATDFSLTYKSNQLLQYYYGDWMRGHNVGSKVTFSVAYNIDEHWALAGNFSFEQLPDKLSNSLNVKQRSVYSYFYGVLFRW